jgi:hypothetical protein
MKKQLTLKLTTLGLLSWIIAWGCEVDDPCDPGQTFENRRCVTPPEGDGDASTGGGDGDMPGDGDGDMSGDGDMGGSSMGGTEMGGSPAVGDGDGDSSTTGGNSGDGDGDTSADGGSAETPNPGASCATQAECMGGTLCGADQGFPQCVAPCGAGEPFEGACPPGTACTEVIPGTSICFM